ncbi:MAG: penicillin-binding protein 2 [Chloroflexi bacterium]|nr:penicillin-binding protein 2 [Chloroflexota bacterium]
MTDNIRKLANFFMLWFLLVALTLGYWQVWAADDLTNDSRINRARLQEDANLVQRGRILDREGNVLAESRREGDGWRRVYTKPELAHVTGFHSVRYGNSNLEDELNGYLRGAQGLTFRQAFDQKVLHKTVRGADVVATIDQRLQAIADQQLGNRRGAVIALEPNTGEILALASHPFFDPNAYEREAERLHGDNAAPLLNRATQGLYVPGSAYKVVTYTGALAAGATTPTTRYTDRDGRFVVDGFPITDRNHPGVEEFDAVHALAYSCNVAFAQMGLTLGAERLVEQSRAFGFGDAAPIEGLPTAPSQVQTQPNFLAGKAGLASTAFGQGQLLATPLQMALVAAAVANGGEVPIPRIYREIRSAEGQALHYPRSGVWRRAMDERVASQVAQAMVVSVDEGWGKPAQIPGVKVAGKTGTGEVGAENQPNAWFIGFAPADQPRIAIAVVVERGEGGATTATPIAQRIMAAALGR